MPEEKRPRPSAPQAKKEEGAGVSPPDHEAAVRPVTRGQQKRRQRSVFQYIAVLFGAAFILLLFTFIMEKRQYDLLQQQNQEQIDNLQQSVSAVQSLQNLYDENDALKEKVEELEGQLKSLQEQHTQLEANYAAAKQSLDQQERSSRAMDWFWQINEAYVRGKYTQCRSLIRELEGAGLVESLPQTSITDNGRFSPYDRYQEIYDHVF